MRVKNQRQALRDLVIEANRLGDRLIEPFSTHISGVKKVFKAESLSADRRKRTNKLALSKRTALRNG